jgi:hypothetical protein
VSERQLAAASERLRGVPGFPRRPGRPRTRPENGIADASRHLGGPADGHNVSSVPQPRAAASENVRSDRARVPHTPVVALETWFGAVVTVAPALLSIADSARYLGVSPRTIEAFVASGLVLPLRLPSPRGGRHLGRVLLERAELDRLVARARERS